MQVDDREILYSAKRKLKNCQIQTLIINDDSPYHPVERQLVEIYISQFAVAYTDECLSNISEQSLEKRNKLPMPIACALMEKHLKGGRYAQVLKIIQNHIDRKTAEKLYVLTYNTAKINQLLGNHKNAVFYLENLLKEEPFFPNAIYDLAIIYSKTFNRNTQSLALLQRHLSGVLKDNNLIHAAYLMLSNDSKATTTQVSKTVANHNFSLANYFNLALLFKKKKDFERSQELFEQLHNKLLQKEESFLKRGHSKDIRLIILTKLNLIELRQQKGDKVGAAKMAYFLKKRYSQHLDEETIKRLQIYFQRENFRSFQLQSVKTHPKQTKESTFAQLNLTISSLKGGQCHKNSPPNLDERQNIMKSYSSRKLKYLLSKQKEIQNFFKNLSIKKCEFPLNVKMSIKNSIQRAKKEINQYKLKNDLEKEDYLKFEEEFQEKKKEKLIELNQSQIHLSIQHILAELQNLQQAKNKNNFKANLPLNSLMNQKTGNYSNQKSNKSQKFDSFLVTKRDLLKKCANFKKQKVSMNLCLQKKEIESKDSLSKKDQEQKLQQFKIVVKNEFQDILPEVRQSEFSKSQNELSPSQPRAQSMEEPKKLPEQPDKLPEQPKKLPEKPNKRKISIKQVEPQPLEEKKPIQQLKKESQEKIPQTKKSIFKQKKVSKENMKVSIKLTQQLKRSSKESSREPSKQTIEPSKETINADQKSRGILSQHQSPSDQIINILQIQKEITQRSLLQNNVEQAQVKLPQTKSHEYLSMPTAKGVSFQRSHTIDVSESECQSALLIQKADKSQIASEHSILHQNTSNSIKNKVIFDETVQQNENVFEVDQVLEQHKSSTSIIPNIEEMNVPQQHNPPRSQRSAKSCTVQSNESIQTLQKQATKQDNYEQQRREQQENKDEQQLEESKAQQSQYQKQDEATNKQLEVKQNVLQPQTQPGNYDPFASSFQLTGFSKILLGKFDEKPTAITPGDTFQNFFISNIKSISAQPCPQIQEKLSEAIQLQKEGNSTQAFKILTALYKYYKGEAEKQAILLAIGRLFEMQHKYEEAQRTYFKSQAFLRLGSLLLKLGRVQAGIENLQKADCIKRFDMEIQNKLVYGYSLRQQTMDKALNLAHNILKKNPSSIQTLIMTAGILQKQGLVKEAIEIVTEIDKVQSTEYIKHYLGILYLQDSNLSEAYNSFKAALSIKADYIPSLIQVASIISDIQSKQAIELLNKVLEKDPTNRKALARLGKIYESVQGDFQSAMRVYQTALDSQENYESYIKLGDCLAKKESYIQALLNYKEALNLKKTSAAYAKLAMMYEMKAEYSKAIEGYQSALVTMKEQPTTITSLDKKRDYLMSIGKLSHKIGQFDAAIASFEEIIEGQQSAQLYKLLGQSYFGKREHEVALQYFEKANNFAKGQDLQILQNLAICLDQLDEYLASKAIYEKILRRDPNNVRCLNNLANILLITGQTNQAFQTFEILLQKAPKNLQKRLKIADIYAQVGDWSKVEYHLLQCYRLKEHDTRVLQKLVTLYKEKRDMRMVAKYQKKLAMRTNHRSKPKQ